MKNEDLKKNNTEDVNPSEINEEITSLNEAERNASAAEDTKGEGDASAEITKAKKKGAVRAFLTSRKSKKGGVALAIIAVFLVCIVLLNIICSLLEDRFDFLSFDVTASNSYELQDDTVKYCNNIDKDVTIYVLSEEDTFVAMDSNLSAPYFTQCNELLKKIDKLNKHITLKYISLSDDPTFTSKYDDIDWTSSDNMILVECGNNYKALGTSDVFTLETDESTYSQTVSGCVVEQGICTALLIVTSENLEKVTFTTGSGEEDYTTLSNLMKNNAFEIEECNLNTSKDISEDSAMVVVYSPSVDLSDEAVDKLTKFLENDGKYGKNLIFFPSRENIDTPNLDSFLEQWGMALSNGFVFETSSSYMIQSGNPYMAITDFANTDYTDYLKSTDIPFLSYYSRGVTIADSELASSLLDSSDEACIYPYDAKEDWDYKDAITGEPISVAAIGSQASDEGKKSSVVVFGSPDDFASSVISSASFCNSDYIISLANKLTDKENMGVTIDSKSLDAKELGVTSYGQIIFPAVLFLGVVPIGVLIAGIVIWARRRKK